jgi:hypothetical protein
VLIASSLWANTLSIVVAQYYDCSFPFKSFFRREFRKYGSSIEKKLNSKRSEQQNSYKEATISMLRESLND